MSLRVLIVEDQVLVALNTLALLEDRGHTVVEIASSVEAALRSIAEHAIDVAVLDVNLNGQLVWPVAHQLRRKGIPFLFVTAYAGALEAPASLGEVTKLDKPISGDQLCEAVEALSAGKGTDAPGTGRERDCSQ